MHKTETKKSKIPAKVWGADFTLAIGCRLNCKYCPQHTLVKRYTSLFGRDKLFMSLEDFKICLSKIETGCTFGFAGMAEPFLNKDCAKMIRYAYEKGYNINLFTTLCGMTEEDFELLQDVRFTTILHIPDAEQNSKFEITEQYLDLLGKFSDKVEISGYSCHGHVHDAVKKYVDPHIPMDNTMMNRAGNLEYQELASYSPKGRISCLASAAGGGVAGWVPEILPNGTVTLCCMDYSMDHILGNIVTQEWDEIFAGNEYLNIEVGFDDERLPILCRKCSLATETKSLDVYRKTALFGPNAVKTLRLLQEGYNEDNLDEFHWAVVRKFRAAKNICIFGLGKLFQDNYWNSLWDSVINANIFSDNDEKKWGQEYKGGISCVNPEELKEIEDLLVITYVTDDSEIREQLKNKGVENIINIYDIYDLNFYYSRNKNELPIQTNG